MNHLDLTLNQLEKMVKFEKRKTSTQDLKKIPTKNFLRTASIFPWVEAARPPWTRRPGTKKYNLKTFWKADFFPRLF